MPGGVSCGGTSCLLSPKSKYSEVVHLFKSVRCSFHATKQSSDNGRIVLEIHMGHFWVQFRIISCCCLCSEAPRAEFRKFVGRFVGSRKPTVVIRQQAPEPSDTGARLFVVILHLFVVIL